MFFCFIDRTLKACASQTFICRLSAVFMILGAIILGSSCGGGHSSAFTPTAAGNNPAAVYRTVKNPYVDAYLREMRKVLYPGGLLGKGRDREEGQATARRIMGFVRDGGRLGIVCDLHDRTGLPVPFFGKPARSVTIPAMIARRLGARIWMSRCMRVGKQSRFQIELKELKVPRSANQADDVKWVTAAMQRRYWGTVKLVVLLVEMPRAVSSSITS